MLHVNVCKVNYATRAGETVVKKLLYDTNTPKGKICCFIFFYIKNSLFILVFQIEKGILVLFTKVVDFYFQLLYRFHKLIKRRVITKNHFSHACVICS